MDEFDRPSGERMDQLLAALRWILPNVLRTPWATGRFKSLTDALYQALPPTEVPPLHEFQGAVTVFTQSCPLCSTPLGERPYDHYFRAWFAWNLIDGVQVGNLLHEVRVLVALDAHMRFLTPRFENAIAAMEMATCTCGRPTTALTDGLCHWCMEDHGTYFVGVWSCREARKRHSETVAELGDFVESIKNCDLLTVGSEGWDAIRTAFLRDVRGADREGMPHLVAAMIGHRMDTCLDTWRVLLLGDNKWPGEWNIDLLKSPSPISPPGVETAWRTYSSLPREAIESLKTPWRQEWPPVIEALLIDTGLLVVGASDDFRGFLGHLPIAQVREISNRLNAGKGRSRDEVIERILQNVTPGDLVAAIPEIRSRWVKEVHGPFDFAPAEWVDYAKRAAPLVENFIRKKFHSAKTLLAARRVGTRVSIDPNLDCPTYCTERAEQFRLENADDIRNVPPWFPGCGCVVAAAATTSTDNSWWHSVTPGTVITVHKHDDYRSKFVTVEPCGLFGHSSASPNGEFRVIWAEGHYYNGEWIQGWYGLIDNDRIAAFGRMDRPNDGKVSANGMFVLNDCMSERKLGGTFWAFDRSGRRLIRRECRANLDQSAISLDGRYAVCSFCGGDTPDAGSVICFDLNARVVVSQFTPGVPLACHFELDSEGRSIAFVYDSGQTFRYSFEGHLHDEEAWQRTWEDQANGYDLLHYVQQQLATRQASANEREHWLALLRRALARGVSAYTQGEVHSVMGELQEQAGYIADAVIMYETAIELAPKLPLRRKLKALKMRLS